MTSIMVCPHDGAECGSHGFCPDCSLSEFEPKLPVVAVLTRLQRLRQWLRSWWA
jgi:hypothetical protein